jgi:uncharacterized membrane protein
MINPENRPVSLDLAEAADKFSKGEIDRETYVQVLSQHTRQAKEVILKKATAEVERARHESSEPEGEYGPFLSLAIAAERFANEQLSRAEYQKSFQYETKERKKALGLD